MFGFKSTDLVWELGLEFEFAYKIVKSTYEVNAFDWGKRSELVSSKDKYFTYKRSLWKMKTPKRKMKTPKSQRHWPCTLIGYTSLLPMAFKCLMPLAPLWRGNSHLKRAIWRQTNRNNLKMRDNGPHRGRLPRISNNSRGRRSACEANRGIWGMH